MHQAQASRTQSALSLALFVLALTAFAPAAQASAGGGENSAVLTGVVRDAQGVAQMGALVQVLGGDARTIATAFTDQHGRYRIADLLPGLYQVRASATLLVPATQNHLRLVGGGRSVVNLTLAALFDTASWLPARARRADEPDDDWIWTLRATASRPILHFDQDGSPIPTPEAPGSTAPLRQVRAEVTSTAGSFGGDGLGAVLDVRQTLSAQAPGMLHGSVVEVRVASQSLLQNGSSREGEPIELGASLEQTSPWTGDGSRTTISYSDYPAIQVGGMQAGGSVAAGVSVVTLRSGERTALGENLALEVGGELQGVQTGRVALEAHPFIKLTAHPHGSWRLQYRMATARDTQGYSDLNFASHDVPVAVVTEGKLMLESGRHQELSVSRNAGRAIVEVAYYHDAISATAVSGGGATGTRGAVDPEFADLMLDPVSGVFRALGNGYTTNGTRVSVSAPVSRDLWIAAEYTTGDALASDTAAAAKLPTALAGLHARNAQAAELALKGRVVASDTRVRASYRWQSEDTVTPVDPYGGLSDQAYLSLFVRQRLKCGSWCGSWLPPGLDATVDVTNLLAQGYRPFLSEDGQTLYFAQSPRTIQAGLSFNF